VAVIPPELNDIMQFWVSLVGWGSNKTEPQTPEVDLFIDTSWNRRWNCRKIKLHHAFNTYEQKELCILKLFLLSMGEIVSFFTPVTANGCISVSFIKSSTTRLSEPPPCIYRDLTFFQGGVQTTFVDQSKCLPFHVCLWVS
jgi:hypothetical protein